MIEHIQQAYGGSGMTAYITTQPVWDTIWVRVIQKGLSVWPPSKTV